MFVAFAGLVCFGTFALVFVAIICATVPSARQWLLFLLVPHATLFGAILGLLVSVQACKDLMDSDVSDILVFSAFVLGGLAGGGTMFWIAWRKRKALMLVAQRGFPLDH